MQLGSRLLVILAVLGLIGGLMIGLWAGWIAWPVQVSNVDVSDLKPSAQDEYVVLIASDYAFDQNLDRAQQRLALLHDSTISGRIAGQAKESAALDKPYAAALAALAVALGSTDNEIALIATTATPTITNTPLPTGTPFPSLTPIATFTIAATATITPTHTPTRRPRATATPAPAPIAATNWIPPYPTEWPRGIKLETVNVAAGQKYWHLVKALYCDSNDTRNDCPNKPGGGTGTNIYVKLISANGTRTDAPLIVTKPDKTNAGVSDMTPKQADDMCDCNYTWEADGSAIQVEGAPSDKVSGMSLFSVKAGLGNFHVRYFLTFQLLIR